MPEAARIQVGGDGPARAGLWPLASWRRRGPAPDAEPPPSEAGQAFIDAVARSAREHGEAETLSAVVAYAEIHAMETGSFLPTNEHPCRYLIRRARETGDEGVLAGAVEEVEGLLPAHAPAC